MLKPGWVLVAGLIAAVFQQSGLPRPDSHSGLIVGRVLDAGTGNPVAGVLVDTVGTPFTDDPVSPAERLPSILTGADGYFVLRRLPAARYTITAARPGYLDGAYGRRRPGGASQQIVLAEGQKSGVVRVYLWRHASISGTVIDEAGEPAVGIQVRAMRRAMSAGQRRFVPVGEPGWADDRGDYRIGALSPGDYVVAAVATQVSLPASTATEMRAGWGASVGIAEIGAPTPSGPSSIRIGDAILALGRSAIGPAPATAAPVYVYPTTFHPDTVNPIRAAVLTIAAGEQRESVDLHIRPVVTRRISGLVSSADGQVDGLPVRVVPEDIEDSPINLEIASTVTNRGGAFVFPAVPVGHYLVQVSKGLPPLLTTTINTGNGRVTSVERLDTRNGRFVIGSSANVAWARLPVSVGSDDISNLVVTLSRGLRVSGHAEFEGTTRRPTGVQVSRASVIVLPASDTSRLPPNQAWFDSSSQFNVVGMLAGKYVLRVESPPPGWLFKSATYNGRDLSDVPLDLQADTPDVVVTFTDRITGISGTVRKADGSADSNATVLLFPTDVQTWTAWGMLSKRFRGARVTPSGSFEISPVLPGEYYIVAVPDEQSTDWQDAKMLEALSRDASSVRVAEGDKKTFDLRTKEIR